MASPRIGVTPRREDHRFVASSPTARPQSLLVGALLRFVHRSFGARRIGFGFVLGDVALRLRLVLLGAPFALLRVVAGDLTDDFLGLALHVLDDSLAAVLGAAVSIHVVCSFVAVLLLVVLVMWCW